MALIIEDGSIVTGANSYGTTAGLIAYATARGKTITSGKEEEYLIRAMDVLEYLPLPGNKFTETQPLQWPRENVVIDGFDIDTDEIPQVLIDCEYECAIAINEGYDPIAVVSRVTKRVTVGPITKEYSSNSPSFGIYQPFYNKLSRLMGGATANNGFEFTVNPA